MDADALARRAALLAHRTRAAMCLAMLDGRAWTVVELGREAGVAVSTASEHVSALAAAGVVAEVRQGRHRYVRLADPAVAQLVEDLAGPAGPPVGLRQVRAAGRLAAARTCYDHLAGDLGVAIHRALVSRRLLTDTGLADSGREWFGSVLGEAALHRTGSRPLVRECLDWTARVPHLGGQLGAALATHLFDRGWIARAPHDRAVQITAAGRAGLDQLLGV